MKLWGTVNSRYLADWTSRTLLYLKQFIPSLVHLALDQSKHSRYFKTRYLKFFLMPNNFYGLLSNFLSLSQTFSKTFTTFCSFSSNISLFSNRAGTISSIVAARISEDSQIYFFFVLFFCRMLYINFFIARIFNKESFKRLFYWNQWCL